MVAQSRLYRLHRFAVFWRGFVNSQNKRKAAADQISELTTGRLSVYLRCLTQLEADGVETTSSQALARYQPTLS